MGLMVNNTLNTPDPSNLAQDISISENLPYTMIPNVWLDEIRYRFNRGVCAIVECVLRETIGYHRATAEITTQEFADYARIGLTATKEAKKEAMEIGIIVLIRRGTGGNTSEYGINLDYDKDDPEAQQETKGKSGRIPKKKKIFRLPGQTPQPSQDPEPPTKSEPKKAQSVENKGKVDRSKLDDSYRGKKDQDQDKETNKNVTDDSEKVEDSEERKKMENVCSLLRNLGFEITDRNLGFLKRMVLKFGLEKILEKIRIMKSQIARNIVIRNFCGWLRRAIELDFQPYDADAKKMEADAARERTYEKGRLEAQKRAVDDQKLIEARQNDPEMKNRINAILAAANMPLLPA